MLPFSKPLAHQPLSFQYKPLAQTLSALLTLVSLNSSLFIQILPLLAATAPGTEIRNKATGSFEDPDNLGVVQEVTSNEVVVRVSEVAGITLTSTTSPEEAPNSVNSSNLNQGDGTIMADDVVYFTYTVTNVGNDQTQFVLPDSPSIIDNGTLFSPIQIIQYDTDGSGDAAPVDLTAENITIPLGGGSVTTGNLLNGVAGTNNGSVPASGTLKIRVPVQVDSGSNDGDLVTVVMGKTSVIGEQNQRFIADTDDIATQDNAGTNNGDVEGDPANGEREASISQVVTVGIDTDGDGIPDSQEGPGDRDGDGIQNNEDFDPQGYLYDEVTGQIIPNGTISVTPAPGGAVTIDDDGSATGFYRWRASVQGGIYTMAVSPPPGYTFSTVCEKSDPPAYDPPISPFAVSLGAGEDGSTGNLTSSSCEDNTFYLSFELNFGDPLIINNNIPLTPITGRDYGDAPDTYGTDTTAGNSGSDPAGPFHTIVDGLHLGNIAPDAEANGQPSVAANEDGADEDGIRLPLLGDDATDYTIPANNITATGTGTLHAWVDFNNNNTFEPGEYQTLAITGGTPAGPLTWNGITVNDTVDTTTYARFRFTTDTRINANTPGGTAFDGEVEDYLLQIGEAYSVSGTIFEDFGSGTTSNNNNDTFDGGEGTIGNVTVQLFEDSDTNGIPDGPAIQTVSSNSTTGQYEFTTVLVGDYLISLDLDDPDIPAPYSIGTTHPRAINLAADLTNQNFGFNNLQVSCPAGSLSSTQIALAFRNPTSEPGTSSGDFSVGATYRFSDVVVDIDALVEIKWLSCNSRGRHYM